MVECVRASDASLDRAGKNETSRRNRSVVRWDPVLWAGVRRPGVCNPLASARPDGRVRRQGRISSAWHGVRTRLDTATLGFVVLFSKRIIASGLCEKLIDLSSPRTESTYGTCQNVFCNSLYQPWILIARFMVSTDSLRLRSVSNINIKRYTGYTER